MASNASNREETTIDDVVSRLVNLRKDLNLSQQDMATRMQVSQPSVSSFESVDSNPTLRSVQRYARGLGARVVITIIAPRRG